MLCCAVLCCPGLALGHRVEWVFSAQQPRRSLLACLPSSPPPPPPPPPLAPLPPGVFSPQDAVDFAQREMSEKGHDAKQTCNRLIHEAIRERRCKDNCTVMLLQLRHGEGQAPAPQRVDRAGEQLAADDAAAAAVSAPPGGGT